MTVVRGAAYTYKPSKAAAYPAFLAQGLGKCATDPAPDDFTASGGRRSQVERRERARRVCIGCPFRYACANWAMETDQEGVYGGTTTAERRRLRMEERRLTRAGARR